MKLGNLKRRGRQWNCETEFKSERRKNEEKIKRKNEERVED